MPLEIPRSLAWVADIEGGRRWLDALPVTVEECTRAWQLELGRAYEGSHVSLVLPARRIDGVDAVLKLNFPHRESDHEAEALARWEGDGAVRLYAADRSRHALLIERCSPGTPLSAVAPAEALGVLAGLLPRLWKPVGSAQFRSLAEEAMWWREGLRRRWEDAGRPFDVRLLEVALDILDSLPATQGEQVLVHQDLHGANVLSAQREPWLVIDPKPLCGEREFGLAPVIRSAELGREREHVRRRLDSLTSDLGVDRERARLWCVAQTVAWSADADGPPHLPEVARWLLEM